MSIWGDINRRSQGNQIKKEDIYDYQEIDPDQLAEMMKIGIVHFKYRKKAKKGQPWDSGEEREAWGTKKMAIIDNIPHGGDCPAKGAGFVPYFDTEKADWRCYLPALVIGVCPHIFSENEFNRIWSGE